MNDIHPIHPPFPGSHDNRWRWGQVHDNALSIAMHALALKNNQAPLLLITPDAESAQRYEKSLQFFSNSTTIPIMRFPGLETLPYDRFSAHQDIVSQRLLCLYQIPKLTHGIIITDIATLMQRLCPPSYLNTHAFVLSCNDLLSMETARQQLSASGFQSVNQVMEHGEFAQRGAIIDMYPMGSSEPYRIELFDDTVCSIRSFDPETQHSRETINRIELLPTREYPLDSTSIARFQTRFQSLFPKQLTVQLYEAISQGIPFPGIDYYLPLFFDTTYSLFDYLPQSSLIFYTEHMSGAAQAFWHDIQDRYEQLCHDIRHPICQPNIIFLSPEQIQQNIKTHMSIQLHQNTIQPKAGYFNFSRPTLPNLLVNHKRKQPFQSFITFTETHLTQGYRLLLCAETQARTKILYDSLNNLALPTSIKKYTNWQTFLSCHNPIGITFAPLTNGSILPRLKIIILTETQLFGVHIPQRQTSTIAAFKETSAIRHLTELQPNHLIVHINYGIGRYQGLTTLQTDDIEAEYLVLEYANQDKIYLPITSLSLISRYAGAQSHAIPLHRLGNNQWEKTKEKTLKRIHDVAAELLDIYKRRKLSQGFTFTLPKKEYAIFSSEFPFQETTDQSQAINDVIKDMCAQQTMDRLICGDVGFGKTEVAIRAAFIATHNHKQVAVLVPTTLLAEQHVYQFQERFSGWPIRIESISRLKTPKQRQILLADIANGKVDIIIGTHQLFSDEILFQSLGLLIIDEEHRFGVRQKEKIKSMRTQIDILTLTATPIPRTLNMALSGIRDLSMITTPPKKRLAIKTFICKERKAVIQEAVMREIMRGGQVYFLYNDVQTMQQKAEELREQLPKCCIGIAHGQLPARALEKVMSDFYHHKHHILLCSTIIESGIDVPNANTIIINRADHFGLAQLHQLRGRIGRSHHQAYAYLFVSPHKQLTSNAKKRLEAISKLNELGAGFQLANDDLEIRGSGELLGKTQSGHIDAVGLTLYLEWLEESVQALQTEKKQPLPSSTPITHTIDVGMTTLLPDDYITDANTRLAFYRQLSDCQNKEALIPIKEAMIDRFGRLPEPTENLFHRTELQQTAKAINIEKINVLNTYAYIHFGEQPKINVNTLITLIQSDPEHYQLQGQHKLRFKINASESATSRLKSIEQLLNHIALLPAT